MKKILIACTILICKVSLSQSVGPVSGTVFINVPIAGSCQNWNNFKVGDSDDAYAGYDPFTGSGPCYTDYLKVTGFNLALPGGVSIKGITVEVERSDVHQRTADYSVRIVKGGNIGAAEKSTGIAYPATDTYQSYGSCTDLWGETWTSADLNSSNFGVAIAAARSSNGANEGKVDHIRVTVCYNFVVLPVTLTAFTAQKNGALVDVKWQTEAESNIQSYEVERSNDGSTFNPIKSLRSHNSANAITYASKDEKPLKGINYYRLKINDNSGKITYSSIAAVHFGSGKNFILYPSAWQKGTDLNVTNPNAEFIKAEFYNMSGSLAGISTSTGRTISTTALQNSKGLILYKLKNKDGQIIGSGILQVF